MKKYITRTAIIALAITLMPLLSHAQVIGDSVYSLNSVLDKLFEEMIPLCTRLIDVGRAIAGFAALWYIAMRVWKHLAKAEEIDFYPLLRPFGIGLAILLFPSLVAVMNGTLKPIEVATRDMAKDSHKAILYHIAEQEKAIKQTPPVGSYGNSGDDTEKYEQPDGTTGDDGLFSGLKNAFSLFNMKSMFKVFISELTQTLYAAASLCINTIRTFYLIVLVILGPLALGLSVFDGFQHTLPTWFARYINTYLWLPVANIFGAICAKVLENMLNLDQNFASSTGYVIFMVISIIGYATVPNVAGYIIDAGGQNTLLHKVSDMSRQAGTAVAKAAAGMV